MMIGRSAWEYKAESWIDNYCHSISGRQFDKHGNLKQWWNNRTIAEFRKAAQCIVDQYSNYTLDEINLSIDGRLTQGENIADNGGLKQAFRVIIHFFKNYIESPFLFEFWVGKFLR